MSYRPQIRKPSVNKWTICSAEIGLDLKRRTQTLLPMRATLDLPAGASSASIPAFIIERGHSSIAPVIFASPHSGTHYPEEMLGNLTVPLTDLRRTEDAFVDELYAPVVDLGATLIRATHARTYVDLNRDARELDAGMFADGLPRMAGMPGKRVSVFR